MVSKELMINIPNQAFKYGSAKNFATDIYTAIVSD